MLADLIEVTPLSGYRLRLRYSDGVVGEIDLAHLVGKGVFKLWNTPGAFEGVSIGPYSELTWGDDVELDADALYLDVTGKRLEEVLRSLKATSKATSVDA